MPACLKSHNSQTTKIGTALNDICNLFHYHCPNLRWQRTNCSVIFRLFKQYHCLNQCTPSSFMSPHPLQLSDFIPSSRIEKKNKKSEDRRTRRGDSIYAKPASCRRWTSADVMLPSPAAPPRRPPGEPLKRGAVLSCGTSNHAFTATDGAAPQTRTKTPPSPSCLWRVLIPPTCCQSKHEGRSLPLSFFFQTNQSWPLQRLLKNLLNYALKKWQI